MEFTREQKLADLKDEPSFEEVMEALGLPEKGIEIYHTWKQGGKVTFITALDVKGILYWGMQMQMDF